jgi:twitching motility protein PilU
MKLSNEIRSLLQVMLDLNASDIYLTADAEPMYRIHGEMKAVGGDKLDSADTERITKSILGEESYNLYLQSNEYNLAVYDKVLGRFRVNCLRQRGNAAIVIRQIKSIIPSIEELNLPETLKNISALQRGLVLIVGATGSGKSTTLASMVDHRNKTLSGHIVTVEDPIEFVHSHKKSIITQREIGLDTQDYHIALKNALRQAPDVVVIGEVRDSVTMEAAVNFAETGHLCLATIHSNNANQALERVMSFFPLERHRQIYMQLSLNLAAVIGQRLIKKSGSEGRVPAIELLLDSSRVKDLILKGEIGELKSVMESSETLGMQTFDGALYALYKSGKISLDDALKNADSVNNLRVKIKLSESGDKAIKSGEATKLVLEDDAPAESSWDSNRR